MEKKVMLERLNLMEGTAKRMRSYTSKQLNAFLTGDQDIWEIVPVAHQIVLQNFYEKVMDLAACSTLVLALIRDDIREVNDD